MKHNNPTFIPNELASAVKGGFVTSAELIKDYIENLNQEEINSRNKRDIENIRNLLSSIEVNIDGLSLQLANDGTDIEEGSHKIATANAVFLFLNLLVESGSLTENLLNEILDDYYTKDETYNRNEISDLINLLRSQIPSFNIKPVDLLPVEDISDTTLYLLEQENDSYILYIHVDNEWLPLGPITANLSDYLKKNELNSLLKKVDNKSILISSEEENNIKITYHTSIGDNIGTTKAVGNIAAGTKAKTLKEKEISQILDLIFFTEIWPTETYSPKVTVTYSLLVKEGTLTWPTVELDYTDSNHILPKNDAQPVITVSSQTFKFGANTVTEPQIIDSSNRSGVWKYRITYSYPEGYFRITSNYGNTREITVSAGNDLYLEKTINVTRPVIIINNGNTEEILKPINETVTIEKDLTGSPIIKIPWTTSEVLIYVKDLGDFLPVNGWSQTVENINGLSYKVFTKQDAYTANLPHRITFKLIKS